MKKVYLLLIIFLTSYLVGCGLVSSNTETTVTNSETKISTTTTETTTTSMSSQTTEAIQKRLQDEFDFLLASIPSEVTEDFSLPDSRNGSIIVTYYQDDVLLTDNIFKYTLSLDGIFSTLTIKLTYETEEFTDTFSIHLQENETEFYQEQINNVFNDIISILDTIPKRAESDFQLPIIDIDGVYYEYSVNQSYIYNNHFVFPYNQEESFLTIEALCVYQAVSYTHTVEVKLLAYDDLGLIPRIYITTDGNQEVVSKEEYINASFSMYSYTETNEEIPLLIEEQIEIRARGNSTLYMPKMSFKLEFNSKTPLVFNYSEKDWVLLANFSDQTLIRTYLANSLSEGLEMDFTPSSAFVDVFMNGEYVGNYMLTDHIKVTNDRVDIEEHSTNTDTGYLIEFDKRLLEGWGDEVEGIDYFMSYGIPYAIKSPKPTVLLQDQFAFIKSFVDESLYALNNGYDYTPYIDIDSFIDWFIVNEVFQNVDSGYSSVFLYKDAGDVLKMGPIWDFDLSAGNPGHLGDDLRQPEGWYTNLQYKNLWYYYLFEYDEFKLALQTRWNEVYNTEIKSMIESIYPVANSISKSRYMNFEKWDIIGSWEDWYTAPEVLAADTYQKQLEFLYNYLVVRSEWLNKEINYF